MDERTRIELEAAVFRRLVQHFQARTDVQNIDLMALSGFCRNCLGDWYREAAAQKGIVMEKDEARALVYGMPPAEWTKKYQKEATPEQKAAFEASQKAHSSDFPPRCVIGRARLGSAPSKISCKIFRQNS